MARSGWRMALGALTMGATIVGCVPDTSTPPPAEPTTVVGDDLVRLNQLQLVGSHNSYHQAPEGTILLPLTLGGLAVPGLVDALGNPLALNYTHAPLPTQLDRGIRTFELDIYADPTGGRFAQPRLPQLLGLQNPTLPQHMDQPGFKVIHIADVDFLSSCSTLQLCLGEIRAWSDAHPGHLPIVINLELKGDSLPLPAELGFTPVLPFGAAELDAVDAELRTALGDRLITPDDVRGGAATLRDAITTTGWPTVRASRGKVLFFMDNSETRSTYLAGHPSLAGRVMFTSSGEGQPDGAILKENDPGDGSRIRSLVQQGYIVRTRADADTVPDPSTAKRDVALASGAQIVHSDYPPGEPRWNTGYVVSFGTRVAARCNPVTTSAATCAAAAVIEP
ncbi:MAG: phosphatidylinositol-specific phospholipase C1-like protein [Acidimicrobiales bacterium]